MEAGQALGRGRLRRAGQAWGEGGGPSLGRSGSGGVRWLVAAVLPLTSCPFPSAHDACRSWNNVLQHTLGFLGFFNSHCRQPGQQLHLSCYRDSFDSFLRYLSFLIARRSSGDYMAKVCYTAQRHLHYLRSAAAKGGQPYGPAEEQQCRRQLAALGSLGYQLKKQSHHLPFDYHAMMRKAGWADAADLIAFIEREKARAIALIQVGSGVGRLAGGEASGTQWSLGAAASS